MAVSVKSSKRSEEAHPRRYTRLTQFGARHLLAGDVLLMQREIGRVKKPVSLLTSSQNRAASSLSDETRAKWRDSAFELTRQIEET